MLPFGASISCAIWEKFATSLHLIIQSKSRNPSILHYLDEILFAGPLSIHSRLFQRHLQSLWGTNRTRQKHRTKHHYIFSRNRIWHNSCVMRLPQDKLHTLRQTIRFVQNAEKVTAIDQPTQLCMQNGGARQNLLLAFNWCNHWHQETPPLH